MEEIQFKAGDCVQLKTGSPEMTISNLSGKRAFCIWFVGAESKDKYISVDALKHCDKHEPVDQKKLNDIISKIIPPRR